MQRIIFNLFSFLLVACVNSAFVAATWAAETDGKLLAPPSTMERTTALALVREVYKQEHIAAKSPGEKQSLAKKMLKAGVGSGNEPAEQYVLFEVASDIAADAGDGRLASEAVEAMAQRFEVDAIRLKASSLHRASKALRGANAHREFITMVMELFDEAIIDDRFDLCRPLGDLARKSARKARDGEAVRTIEARLKGLDAAEAAYAEVEAALAVLDTKPTDPVANHIVGSYRALVQGDWQMGLPMLALGTDEVLRPLALMELEESHDPLELADAWWELAQQRQGREADRLQAHAAHWYRQAQPKLTGLTKARVASRLATVKPEATVRDAAGRALPTGHYGGRSNVGRAQLVAARGGNAASEAALDSALKWLAAHQLPDGGWDLDHRKGPGVRSSRDPGSKNSRNGATALALLPFLGAGHSHKEGSYKKQVGAGLAYLVRNIKLDKNGGSLADGGNMYAHGLGTIALCEAYGMANDQGLAAPSQAVLNYIVFAQDSVGGGWRYSPKQSGDTSVVGWQLTALKTGKRAGLNVPQGVVVGAAKFLDSVQTDSGAAYGYATSGAGAATSAIGLLCRQYLGWKQDHDALRRGVETIVGRGPSRTDFYFNYYASQVMLHATDATGDDWQRWNESLRDQLITTQSKEGGESGSWFAAGGHANDAGGRLYCTSLAALTLEVYYRHPPMDATSEN